MSKRMRRFPRLPGARNDRKAPRPILKGADPRLATMQPDDLTRFARALGGTADDYKLARRVLNMQLEFPAASKPELVTYDWLTAKNIPFDFQAMLYGGRRAKGGLVPDFVVRSGMGGGLAWLINGEYWHSQAINAGRDDTARYRLIGAQYKGMTITGVVELWENDVLRKRPIVFQQALLGIGLRN